MKSSYLTFGFYFDRFNYLFINSRTLGDMLFFLNSKGRHAISNVGKLVLVLQNEIKNVMRAKLTLHAGRAAVKCRYLLLVTAGWKRSI